MSSTDDRIVRMQFDNAEFKKRAADTKQSLADLNKATDAAGKGKGLLNLQSNMQQVSVTAGKMQVATTAALATIVAKATTAGVELAKSLTLDPIRSGFAEYESLLTKQNVIMNATGKSGAEVKKVLNDLNHYSDKTVFSFGDMTEALTSFVNAGVPLEKASQAMQGIANASALAGASTQEAQSSFRAFSQALGQGFLGLQDFRQAAITGKIGTVQFKQTLIDAGVAAGTLTKRGKEYITASGKAITATKGFDFSLQEQWANTEVLNDALRRYGDNTTALGKKAFKAAQDVRTFSAFMDTLKESISSGISQVFTPLLGNLEQSTKFWTGLSNAIGKNVQAFFNWVTVAVQTWRTMGGFEKTLQGFKNILSPIGAIFGTIGKAFRTAFPSSDSGAGKGLYAMSAAFEAITRPLRLVAWLIEQLASPLTLVFMVIKIGVAAVRSLIGLLGDLGKELFGLVDLDIDAGGGFLGWLKDLAKAIVSPIKQVSTLLDKGKSLGEAFKNIKMPNFPKLSLPGLPSLPSIGGGGGDAAGAGASKATQGLQKAQSILKGFGKVLKDVGGGVKEFVVDLFHTGDEIGSAFGTIGDVIKKIGDAIAFVFEKIDWKDVLASFNLAVFATFALSMSRMFNSIADGIKGVAGFGDAAKGVLESTGSALKSFQTQARAKLILNIGIAVALLAASLWVLSKIPADKLATSLAAMGAIFLMLNFTMKSFTKLIESLDGKKTGVTAIALSVAIVALATAMFIMAGALLLMNKVEWSSLIKGLVTMFALVKAMEVIGNLAARAAKNMVAGAFAIGLMAGAMLVMAASLIAFKLVDWGAMKKAGVVIGALVVSLLLLSKVPASTLVGAGVAMLAISVGMIAMSVALLAMAMVKWESIGKLAVVLLSLAVALGIMMAVGGPVAVSGMIGLGIGLIAIAAACLMLNKVDWSSILKLFAVLTLAVVAMAAFGVVAYFVAPALIALGIAMVLLGGGLFLFAAAMALAMTIAAAGTAAFAALATGAAIAIAAFLTSLALQAPIMKDSFLQILQTLIDTLVAAVPMIIKGIKDMWKAVMKELKGEDKKKGAGEGGKGWMEGLLDGIKKKVPMLVQKGRDLLVAWLKGMAERAAGIGAAAAKFVARFLQGVADNIGGVITSGANLIIAWIQGIGKESARIADAAAKAVIQFIHDMADSIEENTEELVKAMGDLGTAMVKGLIKGVTDMAGDALGAIGGLAKGMIGKAKGILKIFSPSKVFASIGKFLVLGLTEGIQNNAGAAITAVASMVSGQIAVANEYVSKYIQDLDQQAMAARAKADGLARAAERAAKAAANTKTTKDDKSAAALQQQADAAEKRADALENRVESAKDAQDRKEQFADASLIEKAQMRSEDAQNQLDAAKAAEQSAARKVAQANALDKQAKAAGVTPAQRAAMEREADALRASAANDAKRANTLLARARASAADALKYQKLAGAEAAKLFQEQFEADAKAAADEEAFSKLSNAEKAEQRRKQAAELQAKAEEDLRKAKELAYTDIQAANDLAAVALSEAEQARRYLEEAENLSATPVANGGVLGTVVNMDPTEDAARGMSAYDELYSAGTAAAAGERSIEFNQYNTSPEALSPTEIYRQSNNLFTFAIEKIDEAAA